jgi:phosphatidylethanolamine-binding protein (PEBP) family uncharacterized protein
MRLILTILAVCAAGTASAQQPAARPKAPARPGLTLTTSAFDDGAVIPNKYTQSDSNPASPKLDWTNVPVGVVSFV